MEQRKPPESEVMLRRLTVDEALIKLDRFLNKTYVAGLHYVRVIHGKGTGTLRLEVRREQITRKAGREVLQRQIPECQGGFFRIK